MADTSKDLIVGIDLGTTNYSVVISNSDGLRILQNEKEFLKAPCFVYFSSKNDLCVGVKAKRLEKQNKKNGFYDFKRFLGREYHDKEVQALIPRMRYTVEEESNKPVFVIDLPPNNAVTPIVICSIILGKIKEAIELKLIQKCNIKAVITVPPNFNENQRKATLEAAESAKIQVLELLDEPKAIALHYLHLYKNVEENDIFLVYNLGGSSFNITTLKLTADNTFDIVDVSADTTLSGREFDEVICSYVLDIINTNDTRLKHEVQIESENIKIRLSKQKTSYLTNCSQNLSEKIQITREQFEALSKNLLQKTIDLLERFLQKNESSISAIKKVIICGGLANMPKIQNNLMQYFKEKVSPNVFIDVDTTAAEEAALYAKMLSTKQL